MAPINPRLRQAFARNQAPDKTHVLTSQDFRENAGPAGQTPFVRTIFPPWVYKLPTSLDFNKNFYSDNLPAVAGSKIVPVSFKLPKGMVGWMQILGIFVQSPTALTDITFSLRINKGPVGGWDNLKPPPGVANLFLQNFSDLQVRVPDSAEVDVQITNNAATGPWVVGAKIAGWYHPGIEEKRIYGEL